MSRCVPTHSPVAAGLVAVVVVAIAGLGGCKQAKEAAKKWAASDVAADAEGGAGAPAVDDDAPTAPPPRPDGPGLEPGTYRLVELRVDVAPTKRGGRAWDIGDGVEADPDPKAVLTLDGHQVATCHAADSTTLRCAPGREVVIEPSSRFALEVWDQDVLSDDKVGTAVLEEPQRWGVGLELPMAPTGQVRAASLRLAPVQTWWATHQVRLLGLAGGVGAALLVIGAFRGRVLVRDWERPPPPRCGHCNARLADDALTCGRCGAPT
ncbi:MAG: hypothetical protein H6708_22750 [Kofleriaceae bacterium]|nr:hypothetical protein [Kofleriaceae bacterium]